MRHAAAPRLAALCHPKSGSLRLCDRQVRLQTALIYIRDRASLEVFYITRSFASRLAWRLDARHAEGTVLIHLLPERPYLCQCRLHQRAMATMARLPMVAARPEQASCDRAWCSAQ